MIAQDALPPYTMTCRECGLVWEPRPARGQDAPTASSLDRETEQHFEHCEGKQR